MTSNFAPVVGANAPAATFPDSEPKRGGPPNMFGDKWIFGTSRLRVK
jgi:hypothetical protein